MLFHLPMSSHNFLITSIVVVLCINIIIAFIIYLCAIRPISREPTAKELRLIDVNPKKKLIKKKKGSKNSVSCLF